MNWEQRLREMVLAGGAVATACGGTTSNASSPTTDSGEAADATTGDAMADGGGMDTSAIPNFCCNANPDPCCEYENCEASLTLACSKELACQEAGTWDAWAYTCEPPADAGGGDAPVDAPGDGTEGDAND